MIPTNKQKRAAYRRWWVAIFPVGAVALISSPFIAPIAWLVEKVLPNNNPLWWWLDDEIHDPKMNEDWLEFKQRKGWWAWIDWHCFRNSMWNLKASLRPESAIDFCKTNDEVIVELIKYDVVRNGQPVPIDTPCLEMPVVRWIDKHGNDGWNTTSGIKVNEEKTAWGELHYWYTANGQLNFREGFVREKTGYIIHGKFPFFGKKTYYHRVAKGANEKRYVYTNKKQIKP